MDEEMRKELDELARRDRSLRRSAATLDALAVGFVLLAALLLVYAASSAGYLIAFGT